MERLHYEGDAFASYLEVQSMPCEARSWLTAYTEVGLPEDMIRDATRSAAPNMRARTPLPRQPGRLETGSITPNNALDRFQGMVRPPSGALSFVVSSSASQQGSKKRPNPFAERMKHTICSSLLLAGPGAALLHYSPPPKALQQRSSSFAASITTAFLTAIAAIKARPIWSLISMLAMVWTYYTSKAKRGESRLTELQEKLLAKVEVLLHFAQSFDTSVSRVLSLVREVECVSRGWGLSSPMPPVSRLEQSSFASAGFAHEGSHLHQSTSEAPSLRAVDVRRVLSQSLRDARQMCKATCSILERFIKGGEDGEELKGLYAAYAVTPESVQLATLALSGRRPRSTLPPNSSPGPIRQRERDSLRSSAGRPQSARLATISSRPGSPIGAGQDEALASPFNPISGSPKALHSTDLERRSSRTSSVARSNRSSYLFAASARPVSATDMEKQGADHGPQHEDLSLASIDVAIELLHASRQRTLCHLLAFDHDAETDDMEERLQTATDAVSELVERFHTGHDAVVAAAEREFGTDCLTLPTLDGPDPILPGSFEQTTLLPALGPAGQSTPREMQSTETLRSFAPPAPPGQHEQPYLDAFAERTNAMSLALRSVTAKMHVAGEDLRSNMTTPEPADPGKIIQMHDSIRSDLELLVREWDQSRVALRQALLPVSPQPPAKPRRRPPDPPPDAAAEDVEAEEGDSSELDRHSSAISSELPTPVDRLSPAFDGDGDEDETIHQVTEQVFEAVGGPPERSKLSREERIRLAKEKRERDITTPPPLRPDANMVVELKDVLKELSERRR